jgi:hypothetical protein
LFPILWMLTEGRELWFCSDSYIPAIPTSPHLYLCVCVHKNSLLLVTGCLLGLFGEFLSMVTEVNSQSHFCLASCTFKVSNPPDVLLRRSLISTCVAVYRTCTGWRSRASIALSVYHFPVSGSTCLFNTHCKVEAIFFAMVSLPCVQMLPVSGVKVSVIDYIISTLPDLSNLKCSFLLHFSLSLLTHQMLIKSCQCGALITITLVRVTFIRKSNRCLIPTVQLLFAMPLEPPPHPP